MITPAGILNVDLIVLLAGRSFGGRYTYEFPLSFIFIDILMFRRVALGPGLLPDM